MRTELLSPHPRAIRARSGDIRLDLPDNVVDRLVERANAAGQSLEWYVNTELTKLAARPNADELLERIRSSAALVADVRKEGREQLVA